MYATPTTQGPSLVWPHTCPLTWIWGYPSKVTNNKKAYVCHNKRHRVPCAHHNCPLTQLWGHSLFFHPYKDIGCLFFSTHKDNANPKKKPFSRHSNILTPLSHTSHFTSRKLNSKHILIILTPNQVHITYDKKFPIFKYLTTLVALTLYTYIYKLRFSKIMFSKNNVCDK